MLCLLHYGFRVRVWGLQVVRRLVLGSYTRISQCAQWAFGWSNLSKAGAQHDGRQPLCFRTSWTTNVILAFHDAQP